MTNKQDTVYDLIQWLKTLPSDAKVNVLEHTPGTGYYDQGGWCHTIPFNHSVEEYEGTDYNHAAHWELYGDSVKGYTLTLGATQ